MGPSNPIAHRSPRQPLTAADRGSVEEPGSIIPLRRGRGVDAAAQCPDPSCRQRLDAPNRARWLALV